jgi:prepilin-type N-terminal cleavage/methylation domain-containing protein
MNRSTRSNPSPDKNRSGFTLVEMLVSVTLVLLMMTMFASIFSMATDSVSKQRGISNHDQKARSLVTIMHADFQHRTLRYPLPFYPGEDSSTSPTPFGNRAGYFYISTNDSYSGLDDLIQFTVNSDILIENTDETPYFAKALTLSDRTFTTATNLSVNPNQPEADDGSLMFDGTSSSNAAEVCYFVRNGNLYRRIQLLRKPLPVAGRELDDQPVTSRGYSLVSGFDNSSNYDGQFWFDVNLNGAIDAGELSNDFWRHFDFSAVEQNYGGNQSAHFLGLGALTNELISSGAANESLGNPRFRFGFHHPTVDVSGNPVPTTGLSREHTAIGGLFIGRFTQAETSASNFNWPQRPSHVFNNGGTVLWSSNATPGDPFDVRTNLVFNSETGVVEEFSESAAGTGRGGPRKMEDLLLANVHEMKVEIWDERLQKYTTPGHSESVQMVDINGNSRTIPGDYHQGRRFADADGYGPQGSSVGVFDTWHPNINRDNNVLTTEHPPHIAYRYTPPVYPVGPTRQGLPLGPDAEPDRSTRRADNRGYWQPNTEYNLGDVVFVPWDESLNSIPPDGVFQYIEMDEPKFNIAYRCVARQGAFTSAGTKPGFATAPGRRIRELNDELEWESFDNRRPLSSIRLTLRFMDQTSDTQRQLSLIIPLTDKK